MIAIESVFFKKRQTDFLHPIFGFRNENSGKIPYSGLFNATDVQMCRNGHLAVNSRSSE